MIATAVAESRLQSLVSRARPTGIGIGPPPPRRGHKAGGLSRRRTKTGWAHCLPRQRFLLGTMGLADRDRNADRPRSFFWGFYSGARGQPGCLQKTRDLGGGVFFLDVRRRDSSLVTPLIE